MIQNVTFEETTYSESAAKFEAGTPNIGDAVGLARPWTMSIDSACQILPARTRIAGLRHRTAVANQRFAAHRHAREKVGVLSFVLPNRGTEDIGRLLDQEGIAVRAGHHCSQPSLRRFGVETTVCPSLSLYNTTAESTGWPRPSSAFDCSPKWAPAEQLRAGEIAQALPGESGAWGLSADSKLHQTGRIIVQEPRGAWINLSAHRVMICDLMHASRKLPTIPVERRMQLGAVVEARRVAKVRPSWPVIFAKAFAVVAEDMPELRRCYLALPWARLYEHSLSIASVAVEKSVPATKNRAAEKAVFFAKLRRPNEHRLIALDRYLKRFANAPSANMGLAQLGLWLTWLPWPLRRFLWWYSLNAEGYFRCRQYGTYGVSVDSSLARSRCIRFRHSRS